MRPTAWTLVSVVALWGCGGTPSGPVTGHAIDFHRLESSEVSLPNPGLPTFKAFVARDDGGLAPLTFTVEADGGFSIPDAPPGEYYVQIGTQYFVTQSRRLDLDDHSLQGRPDAVPMTQASLVLSVTGLVPQASYEFEVSSPEVGLSAALDVEGVQLPAISNQAANLSAYAGALPDGTPAAHTWISEIIDCSLSADGGRAALDGGAFRYCESDGPGVQLAGLAVDPDGGTTLDLTLAPTTAQAVTATFDPANYLAHQGDVRPGELPRAPGRRSPDGQAARHERHRRGDAVGGRADPAARGDAQ